MSGGSTSACRKWLCDLAFVAVTAASGTALLVAIIVLVYDLRLTGSAADLLATLCNAVVATAAVAAFLVARSWLPQMATQEGYKTAIALVNDCYSQLGETHPMAVAAARAMEAYDKVAEELPATTVGYEDAINLLRVHLDAALLAPESIKSFRFSLNTYGLTEDPHYKADLETMVEAFEASLPVGQVLLEQLQADLKRRKAVLMNRMPDAATIWETRLQQDRPAIKSQHKLYIEAAKKFQAAHAAVFDGRPSIGDLFVPRKRRWLR